jgi:hypothetical protein
MFKKIMFFISLGVMVGACDREMTTGEVAYSEQIFTKGLAFQEVRVSGRKERGARKLEALLEENLQQIQALSRREESAEKMKSSLFSLLGADAITIGNSIYFSKDFYTEDFATSTDDSRWLLAHELTHVWQWQNRGSTGYSFAKVISEHLKYGDDAYRYRLVAGKKFSEYRFEQQGQIIQCYAMYKRTRPNAPLTAQHQKIIRAEFPIDEVLDFVGANTSGPIRVRNESLLVDCMDG